MQNFDFHSLYNPPSSSHSNQRPYMGPNMVMGSYEGLKAETTTPGKPKSGKKMARIVTIFLVSILISFTSGLVAGFRLSDKPHIPAKISETPAKEVSIGVQERKEAKEESVSSSKIIEKRDDKREEKGSTVGEEKKEESLPATSTLKFYVKIFPPLLPANARSIAKGLLEKKYNLHYSKLANGNYLLFAGPYQSKKEALRVRGKLEKLPELSKEQVMTKIVRN